MAKYRPDIKPPMWGPPEAVQYAVRANAERIGISAPFRYWPMWEGAYRPVDVMTGLVPTSYNGLFTPFGIAFGNSWFETQPLATYPQNGVGFLFTGNIYNVEKNLGHGVIDTRRSTTDWGTVNGFSFVIRNNNSVGRVGGLMINVGTTDIVVDAPTRNLKSLRTVVADLFSGSYAQASIDGDEKYTGSKIGSYSPTTTRCRIGGYYDYSTNALFQGNIHQLALFGDPIISADSVFGATPYALIMPVSRPVYFDLGAAGGTLTTDSAWKIYTAAEIDTAWSIRAALSQSAAWAVFTRDDTDSAWSIRTSAEAETSWTVRAGLDTTTAWPIATAADTQTEWQIKAGIDAETAWPIFTAVDTATAWAILNSLALETPTSWSIRNALAAEAAWSIRTALDTGSAWAILSRLDRETAWQILGAGILDTPTSWAIRADLDQATAWTIKTSLDADTDWTIINGMDTATAWDILQGFATDTAWQVYRGLNTATAWSIISDTVPEPVRVFMAERRDFIINAEKRIFILLAERK